METFLKFLITYNHDGYGNTININNGHAWTLAKTPANDIPSVLQTVINYYWILLRLRRWPICNQSYIFINISTQYYLMVGLSCDYFVKLLKIKYGDIITINFLPIFPIFFSLSLINFSTLDDASRH